MKKVFIALSLFLISQMVFSACTEKIHDASETEQVIPTVSMKKELQDSVGISFVEVKKQRFISSLEVYGSVSEDTENTKHIVSKGSGILKSFTKTVGDTVEVAEVIALIQTTKGEDQ